MKFVFLSSTDTENTPIDALDLILGTVRWSIQKRIKRMIQDVETGPKCEKKSFIRNSIDTEKL